MAEAKVKQHNIEGLIDIQSNFDHDGTRLESACTKSCHNVAGAAEKQNKLGIG